MLWIEWDLLGLFPRAEQIYDSKVKYASNFNPGHQRGNNAVEQANTPPSGFFFACKNDIEFEDGRAESNGGSIILSFCKTTEREN